MTTNTTNNSPPKHTTNQTKKKYSNKQRTSESNPIHLPLSFQKHLPTFSSERTIKPSTVIPKTQLSPFTHLHLPPKRMIMKPQKNMKILYVYIYNIIKTYIYIYRRHHKYVSFSKRGGPSSPPSPFGESATKTLSKAARSQVLNRHWWRAWRYGRGASSSSWGCCFDALGRQGGKKVEGLPSREKKTYPHHWEKDMFIFNFLSFNLQRWFFDLDIYLCSREGLQTLENQRLDPKNTGLGRWWIVFGVQPFVSGGSTNRNKKNSGRLNCVWWGLKKHVWMEAKLKPKVRGCAICVFHFKTLDLKKAVVEIPRNMLRSQHTVTCCWSICIIEKVNPICLRKHIHIIMANLRSPAKS